MIRHTKLKTHKKIFNLSEISPLTDVYSLARSFIALSTFSSLLFNNSGDIFKSAVGIEQVPICTEDASYSFFCIFNNYLPFEYTVYIALIFLLLVIIGFYPRYLCIPHYWIAVSYTGSATLLDGGDQVNTVLSLLLIPICLLDSRKWGYKIKKNDININQIKNIFLWITFSVITLQVAIIYLNASIEKLKVSEWSNGTALYYYLTTPILGIPKYLEPLMLPLLTNPYFIVIMTYGTLIFEFLLFCSLFMNQSTKYIYFILGITFHFTIIIMLGLPTFFFSMVGALVLLLLPKKYTLRQIIKQYKNDT